ncbi:CoA pyrophosphatase [Novosphingobium flavum]|uniref:CoA pyrophosphatase n=1 Tax=Novosphingobium flavum TaxID=1778672 RepID=A0A7X1FRG6_9SPHN|nr:CoA pyrophosphatase [Novosphingobium flavum]MBC2665017.1 CoA pyrophosphatase [Novosphingobium flavum]
MSALFTRLSELHLAGHAREGVAIHHDSRVTEGAELRPAAVLAAVTERERPGLLLIHRPSTMRAHPGQVALPGGKIDAGESPVDAALREAYEELGIHADQVRIVGESDVYRTGSGYEITPVIGMIPPDIALDPNPSEVARWFEAPLDFVLDPANHREHSREWEGRTVNYWEITWQEHRIWGITAGLLVNLSRRWRWHD